MVLGLGVLGFGVFGVGVKGGLVLGFSGLRVPGSRGLGTQSVGLAPFQHPKTAQGLGLKASLKGGTQSVFLSSGPCGPFGCSEEPVIFVSCICVGSVHLRLDWGGFCQTGSLIKP